MVVKFIELMSKSKLCIKLLLFRAETWSFNPDLFTPLLSTIGKNTNIRNTHAYIIAIDVLCILKNMN